MERTIWLGFLHCLIFLMVMLLHFPCMINKRPRQSLEMGSNAGLLPNRKEQVPEVYLQLEKCERRAITFCICDKENIICAARMLIHIMSVSNTLYIYICP